MKKVEEAVSIVKEVVPSFNKEQVLKSKRYANRKDALSFLLEDGKAYSHADIDSIIEKYMKGKVK